MHSELSHTTPLLRNLKNPLARKLIFYSRGFELDTQDGTYVAIDTGEGDGRRRFEATLQHAAGLAKFYDEFTFPSRAEEVVKSSVQHCLDHFFGSLMLHCVLPKPVASPTSGAVAERLARFCDVGNLKESANVVARIERLPAASAVPLSRPLGRTHKHQHAARTNAPPTGGRDKLSASTGGPPLPPLKKCEPFNPVKSQGRGWRPVA